MLVEEYPDKISWSCHCLVVGIMLHAVLSAYAMIQPRNHVAVCQASNLCLPMFGAKEMCPGAV